MSALAERFVTAFERLVECECMPEFPSMFGSNVVKSYGADTSITYATEIDMPFAGGAHTKGAVVELVSATPFSANWIAINFLGGGENVNHLIDIMVGAASSEQVLIPNLLATFPKTVNGHSQYLFPVFIPAGTRLSAHGQAEFVGSSVRCTVQLYSGGLVSAASAGPVSAYGPNTAASVGTNVDPGATAHTKSAWVELTASTIRQINWLVLAMHTNDASLNSERFLVDIGIGGSGSEVVLVENILACGEFSSDELNPRVWNMPVHVPVGTRLAVRAQCSGTTDLNRDLYVALYGV